MIKVKQNIEIGDKFKYGKHNEAVVIDLVKTFSTARNEFNEGYIYVAKLTTGFARNSFEVCKVTVQRGFID